MLVFLLDLVLLLAGDVGFILLFTIYSILSNCCSFGGDIIVDWNGLFHPGDNVRSSAIISSFMLNRFCDIAEFSVLSLSLLRVVSRPFGGICPMFGVVMILSIFGSSMFP